MGLWLKLNTVQHNKKCLMVVCLSNSGLQMYVLFLNCHFKVVVDKFDLENWISSI